MYEIIQRFISMNRSYQTFNPIGLVIHETANPGDSCSMEWSYFNSQNVYANAHIFVDPNVIVQFLPLNEKGWHCCKTGNSKFIGVEMCHALTKEEFDKIWDKTVWLFAYIFINTLKITKITKDNLMSHDEVSNKWQESNHHDPVEYFNKYGKNIDIFRSEVQMAIDNMIIEEKLSIFKDKDQIADYAKESIQHIVDLGIMKGSSDGNLYPQNPITRQDAAVLLSNLLKLLGK